MGRFYNNLKIFRMGAVALTVTALTITTLSLTVKYDTRYNKNFLLRKAIR
jgi:hypothetical protein